MAPSLPPLDRRVPTGGQGRTDAVLDGRSLSVFVSDDATDATANPEPTATGGPPPDAGTGDAPPEGDEPGGRAALVRALEVPRNARRGFAFGIAATVAVFVFFVVIPGVTRSPLYYMALAFTLAAALGGLATTVLIGLSAYRLSKEL